MQRALPLSGGGSKGAYQAGVIYNLLAERRIQYDILSGTSVGALNALLLAMYPHGQEVEAAEALKDIWYNVSTGKVHKLWYKGFLGYLSALWQPSVFNTEPLENLVESMADVSRIRSSGKKLRVVGVSLNTGEMKVWTEQDDDIVQGVLASASYPLFLEPVKIGDQIFTDGGLREVTPTGAAIKAGATHLDIVQCQRPGSSKHKGIDITTIEVGKQSLSIMMDEVAVWDIKAIDFYNAIIKSGIDVSEFKNIKLDGKRFITTNLIYPEVNLVDNALDFSPDIMRKAFEIGLEHSRSRNWDIPTQSP